MSLAAVPTQAGTIERQWCQVANEWHEPVALPLGIRMLPHPMVGRKADVKHTPILGLQVDFFCGTYD
jgi:hypothetical protein